MNLIGKEGIERLHGKVLRVYRDYMKQSFRIKNNKEQKVDTIEMVREAFSKHKETENYGESSFLYSYAKTYHNIFKKYIDEVTKAAK